MIMSANTAPQGPIPVSKKSIESEENRLLNAATRRMAEKAADSSTNMLSKESRDQLPLTTTVYGLTVDSAHFQPLPKSLAAEVDLASLPIWQIDLQGLGTQRAPIGIEIRGDIVIGVERGNEPHPDLDMSPYGASELGVSRIHAMIRPTRSRLYLIDLQSTNGTQLNALPVGPGMAMELRNGDTISLGNLNFNVRIINKPQ
jgi:hypothetical protein